MRKADGQRTGTSETRFKGHRARKSRRRFRMRDVYFDNGRAWQLNSSGNAIDASARHGELPVKKVVVEERATVRTRLHTSCVIFQRVFFNWFMNRRN